MKLKKALSNTVGLLCLFFVTNLNGQTNSVLGIRLLETFDTIHTSFVRSTETTYSLSNGLTYDSLPLMDKYYLQPSSEKWTTIKGYDDRGKTMIVNYNHENFTSDAKLGYQIKYIVTSDTAYDFYDYRDVLVRHKSHSNNYDDFDVPNTSSGSTSNDNWDQVINISSGIVRYVATGIDIIKNTNNGNIIISFDDNGKTTKIFENREVIAGNLGDLNYTVTLVPINTPTGLCATRIISETYSNRNEIISPRSALSSLENQNIFQIFPNPASSSIRLAFTGTSTPDQHWSYKIYSINGDLMAEKSNIAGNSTIIDINNFEDGVYIIQVYRNNIIKTQKIIKL